LVNADSVEQAKRHLTSTIRPHAVIVGDVALLTPQFHDVLTLLIDYVAVGGTVVHAGLFSGLASRRGDVDVGAYFKRAWNLPWHTGSRRHTRGPTRLNAIIRQRHSFAPRLPKQYTQAAVLVNDVELEDALYLTEDDFKTHVSQNNGGKNKPAGSRACVRAAAAFARVGGGHVGYVGDVLPQHATSTVVLGMCFHLLSGPPMAPGSAGKVLPPIKKNSKYKKGKGKQANPQPVALGKNIWDPQAAERAVARRTEQRARTHQRKSQEGDGLKDEGNALFRAGHWAAAAEKYRAAVQVVGPQPMYLSNLAACLLKYEAADSAASRALMYEPNHLKALYRRAQARVEMGRPNASENEDLLRLLKIDPDNGAALAEQQRLEVHRKEVDELGPLDTDISWEGDPDDDAAVAAAVSETITPLPIEDEDESDTEDFAHNGNGTPCKFYNRAREGCRNGVRCPYRHAPDVRSVRDKLGRNVCLYWLVGACKFDSPERSQCVYSHHDNYLPERGWWKDEARLSDIRARFRDAVRAQPLRRMWLMGRREDIIAEAPRPTSWRRDLWAV
ncbi:TPR-like protein, partial [Epithele typhae]|uniref:TPR-like protein n=1 Tax=Epithele typhae TaxID=378194 RepID=UPI0020077CD6